MKNIIHRFSNINEQVQYTIGSNKRENSYIVEKSNFDDIWFHASDYPSCHVIAKMPKNLNKKQRMTIIKFGVLLCKQNTNQLKNMSNILFNYTKIKNVKNTEVEGMVVASELKYIKL